MPLCSPWIAGTDVATCCETTDDAASDPSLFDSAAEVASELLFYNSGRRFPGVCGPVTARPCRSGCGCPWQVLSRGYVIWNPWLWGNPLYGYWGCADDSCGCRPLSQVRLAGRVIEVLEVLIDGEVVDPLTYRVDQQQWLTRVRVDSEDELDFWPGCQNMDLADTEPGTFAVTYTYGQDVPISGINAAIELACNIYKACNGQKCALPTNTIRNARQGLIVERPSFTGWGFERGGRSIPKGWNTGMPQVDAFLNAFNPSGLVRMPLVWTPTRRLRYAPTLGLGSGS